MTQRQITMKYWIAGAFLVASVTAHSQQRDLTAEEQECGTMVVEKRVAPMDYRTDRKLLYTVENGHFRPHVENLTKPMFDSFGADLDYTLHAYPNHHRALVTLVRLGEREKTDHPKQMAYPIDCFFRRAIRQASDDLIVRMLYAQYLIGKSREQDAARQLDFVAALAKDNPFTHYNLGRLHLEMKSYDKAAEHARLAAELGFERSDLKDTLVKLGKWPAAAASAPAGKAASAAVPAASAPP